ncbi:plasmid partition protein ParG [Nostoc sp. ATCC 53789]|nr:plasmid partition protein ParG [Nostoc sp. ATCC 53789]
MNNEARFKAACALINRPMDEVMAELIEEWLKTQDIK